MILTEEILKKHEIGIEAARRYWITAQPTGFSDEEFNKLELEARKDGLELRDYVFSELPGTRYPNASYISKVEKEQVPGDMYSAVLAYYDAYKKEFGEEPYFLLKYDGSSIVAYYNPQTGELEHIVTAGGNNRTSDGIDQTVKFKKFFPQNLLGSGICAVQCECLVSLEHGFGETSRQKANGLVNSAMIPMTIQEFTQPTGSKKTKEENYQRYLYGFEKRDGSHVPGFFDNRSQNLNDIENFINFRAFRFFADANYIPSGFNYWNTLGNLPLVYNNQGDVKFSPAMIMTINNIKNLGPDIINKDIWTTNTGTFMVDGIVIYSGSGQCVKALKYKDAGRGETALIKEIQWNDQSKKGKDSWSANAIIDPSTPVSVRGSEIKKPSVGSITKMVNTGLSKGARATIILANSTIPMIDKVVQQGNLDYQWPVCSCGYQMSEKDIYGSLLKCGNPNCTKRYNNMVNVLKSLGYIDLNKLLIIDRFDWNKKITVPIADFNNQVDEIMKNGDIQSLETYLSSFMTTDLQKRNLHLVIGPAWKAIKDVFYGSEMS